MSEEGKTVFSNLNLPEGSGSGREQFEQEAIRFPVEVSPLNEDLWKDLQPDTPDPLNGPWQPGDAIYHENYSVGFFYENSLSKLEDPSSPLSQILGKLQHGEPLTEKEQRRVDSTDNMVKETFITIERGKALQEKYAQNLAQEQQQIDELQKKEEAGNITDDERSKLGLLQKHLTDGTKFLEEQKQRTIIEEAKIKNSKWLKR